MYRSPANFLFSFFLAETLLKCLNTSLSKAAIFELAQQSYATETGNVASEVSTCAAQP